MSKLPQVVLVGRTNVGKSTLFNRLSETVKSITLDRIGVTRDFLQDKVCWNNACFNFVDTVEFKSKKRTMNFISVFLKVSSVCLKKQI